VCFFQLNRYLKEAYSGTTGTTQDDLQQHQIYDLIVHYRKSGNIEKNVKYLTLAARSAFDHNDVDSAHLLYSELVKVAAAGRSLSDIMLDVVRPEVAPSSPMMSRCNSGCNLNALNITTNTPSMRERFGALASLSLSIEPGSGSPLRPRTGSFLSPAWGSRTGGSGREHGTPSSVGSNIGSNIGSNR
jgi:hypothetical protein